MQGTWKTTSRGGLDLSGLFYAAAVFGIAAGVAFIVIELMWAIVIAVVVATAVWLWLHHRRTATIAVLAEKGALIRKEQQDRADRALAEQRRHELEMAHASRQVIAPVIQIGADFLAAAVAGAQQQPQPVPVRVLPGIAEEVRRG